MHRRFQLHRKDDETGVSGTGVVAEGIQFSNNECVLVWLSKRSSIGIYTHLADIDHIHGHEGKTRIVWIDDEPEVVTKEVVETEVPKEATNDSVAPPASDDVEPT